MKYVDTPQSSCWFGLRVADITPPVGIYHRMWGAAAHDRAEGVHRPLRATAMAFRPWGENPGPDSQQVLVALDHCLLGAAEVGALRDAVAAATGLASDAILVVFSHTHAAGLMSLDREALPGGELIRAYLQRLHGTVAEQVGRALAAMQPSTISYAHGRCDLAAHRDLWDGDARQWVCGFNPDQPADDTLLVARVTGADDRLLATIVNYACHPTTLGWQNRLISPDFPGALREVVEQGTGAPCVFLQGASGDLGPRAGFVGEVDVADRNGRQLGHAALSTWLGLPPPRTRFVYTGPVVSGATLGTWSHVPWPAERRQACAVWRRERGCVRLPYRCDLPKVQDVEKEREELLAAERQARGANDEAAAGQLRALAERKTRLLSRLRSLPSGQDYPLEIVLWRMGDAVWVAVEGEPYHRLQKALRARFPKTPTVIAALANGWGPSYLPPREVYGTGIYQESVAVLEAGSLERLTDELADRIERCLMK